MFDENDHTRSEPEGVSTTQLSLFELFFVMTLCAVALWLYIYVSPFIATMTGAALVFVLILRQLGRRPLFIGGLAGFLVAMFLSFIVCLLNDIDDSLMVIMLLVVPSAGYIAGGFMTELAEDDWP